MNITISLIINLIWASAFIFLCQKTLKNICLCGKKDISAVILAAIFTFACGVVVSIFGSETSLVCLILNISVLWICATASVADIETRIIPYICTLAIFVCGLIKLIFRYFDDSLSLNGFLGYAAGALFAFCLMAVSGFIVKNGIGAGDIMLLTALGFYFGLSLSFGIVFRAVAAAFLFGIALLLLKKAGKKTTIPFAPFIFLGVVITVIKNSVSEASVF